MSEIPAEFTAEALAELDREASDGTQPLYAGFHRSGEPYRSLVDLSLIHI